MDRILRKCGGWLWGCGAVEVQSLDGLPLFLGVGGVGSPTAFLDGWQHRLAAWTCAWQPGASADRKSADRSGIYNLVGLVG